MQVARWGNSLAVRIPASVVEVMKLREGDEIVVRIAPNDTFELSRLPTPEEVLARIRNYRGRLPKDFRFSRQEAHERG